MTGPNPLLAAAVCSERGRLANNEDNYLMNGRFKSLGAENQPMLEQCAPVLLGVFAVCDGMGGTSFGEVAAAMAVARLAGTADRLHLGESGRAAELLSQISAAIRQEAARRKAHMGAAIVVAVTRGRQIDIYNVGDCRAYLWTPHSLRQLSEDHTVEQIMQKIGGNISSANHQLTQFLGMDEEEFFMEPYHIQVELPVGGKLLLCSDGLTDMISEQEIASCLSGVGSLKAQTLALVDRALEAGGRDNVTAMIIAELAEGS
jgi:serine/threonine protein phosphatase PrpC